MKTGPQESLYRPLRDGAGTRAVVIAVAFSLGCLATAQAVPLLQYEAGLSLPNDADRGSLAVAVTPGPDGGICVTDATTHGAHLFDHRNVHVFSTSDVAGLGDPMDITVDPGGGFVCTDSRPGGGRTIRRLDFYGLPIAYDPVPPVERWQPEHLLLTHDGNFVTTDASNGLLAKHDAATGALLWKRTLGEGPSGEIIAIGRPAEAPDGHILLPLPGNHQVAVLSANGEPGTGFGTAGVTRGRLSFPVGAAFGPGGAILVLDRMRHTILLYDGDRRFVSEFGTFGMGPTDLYYPNSIVATPDGRIYVTQGFQRPVQEYRFVVTESSRSGSFDIAFMVPGARNGSAVPHEEGEEVSVASQHISPRGLEAAIGVFSKSPSGSFAMEAIE